MPASANFRSPSRDRLILVSQWPPHFPNRRLKTFLLKFPEKRFTALLEVGVCTVQQRIVNDLSPIAKDLCPVDVFYNYLSVAMYRQMDSSKAEKEPGKKY
jgi:hypothetical protein